MNFSPPPPHLSPSMTEAFLASWQLQVHTQNARAGCDVKNIVCLEYINDDNVGDDDVIVETGCCDGMFVYAV